MCNDTLINSNHFYNINLQQFLSLRIDWSKKKKRIKFATKKKRNASKILSIILNTRKNQHPFTTVNVTRPISKEKSINTGNKLGLKINLYIDK